MPPPRPLSAFQAKRSLANRFGRLADNVRQLATKLGIRPYRVFLVWSQYDGQVRGEGNESVIARVEVLPTPRVSELTSVQLALYGAGNLPTGTLRIDQISVAKWNEAQLMGRALPTDTDAEHIPPHYDFWYEIVEDGRGGNEPMRTRYRLLGVPFRNAGGVQWGVLVERQQDDATPNGQPQFAPR